MSARARREQAVRQSEERVREETRAEERGRAKALADTAERAQHRLRQLYAIGKELTRFDTVDRTVPVVLDRVCECLPLRAAILMLEDEERSETSSLVFQAEGAGELSGSFAHAKVAYSYLVRRPTSRRDSLGGGLDRRPLPSAPPSAPPSAGSVSASSSSLPRDESVSQRSPAPPSTGGFVFLPLVVEHTPIFGALQIEALERLDEADLTFLNAVVNHLAVAIDRAARIDSQHAATQAAHAAAEFLSEASATLFSSMEYETTIAAVVRSAVPRLADVCFVSFVDQVADVAGDGGEERVVTDLAPPPGWEGERRRMRVGPSTPADTVLETGNSVLLGDLESRSDLAVAEGTSSLMSVPLRVGSRTLGALTFVALGSRARFSTTDLALAEEVARRAAVAVVHAELYRRAQREVRARQEMLAMVSHDLRNPLGTILLITSSLAKDVIPESEWRRKAETIGRSAKRMDRLIADLLCVAGIEAGTLAVETSAQPTSSLVDEAIESQRSVAASKGIKLEGVLVTEDDIECDRGRLLQVLDNLIGNAIKFTPRNGSVTLRAERNQEDVLFSVADTGPGIEADDVARIFDRYWQAPKTARLGTGLGLTIAKALVEAHLGRIWVRSALGLGATFFFTIPITEAARRAEAPSR